MTYTIQKKTPKPSYNEANPIIEKEKFIQIWGFMMTDLRLEKTELLVYAVIFSMYKNHCDYYTGSREYLQGWCNAGKTTVDNALVSLVRKGLIIKECRRYGKMQHNVYIINTAVLPDIPMFDLEKIHSGVGNL